MIEVFSVLRLMLLIWMWLFQQVGGSSVRWTSCLFWICSKDVVHHKHFCTWPVTWGVIYGSRGQESHWVVQTGETRWLLTPRWYFCKRSNICLEPIIVQSDTVTIAAPVEIGCILCYVLKLVYRCGKMRRTSMVLMVFRCVLPSRPRICDF